MLSVTHKNVGFDNRMPAADFEGGAVCTLPGTGILPVKTPQGRWAHMPHLIPEE